MVNSVSMQPELRQRAYDLLEMCPSRAMQEVRTFVGHVATTNCNVVISGPTGAGKEIVARALHECSQRAEKPFEPLNCGAIPADLAESLLFGHEQGAFTGAMRRHHGVFERANGGTVLLDEIGDLPLNLQVKLLRVLDMRAVMRVGSEAEVEVDFRLIAATNRDLSALVDDGKFRADLYYRLNVFAVCVPPLCERREDISYLADYFLQQLAPGRNLRFASPARAVLQAYHWRGNVRELQTIIERVVVFARESDTIHPKHLSDAGLPKNVPTTSKLGDLVGANWCAEVMGRNLPIAMVMDEVEAALIYAALERANGVVSRAADLLQMCRSKFYRRLHRIKMRRS